MTNPFDDEAGRFQVLTNDQGQHSLWPEFAEVPDGWSVALPTDTRQACLAYVEANWTDLRPLAVAGGTSA
ncbi:MbtH family protein [Streptomyces sp. NPDC056637]|jgi:MbtH protein|uniref:MbtH family protein n=1 Tax=unclassified Streptomyces TaxID=2593676 RepID=UPI00362BC692